MGEIMIKQLNKTEIELAETKSKTEGDDNFHVFVKTSGTALNLLMDKVDELTDAVNELLKKSDSPK